MFRSLTLATAAAGALLLAACQETGIDSPLEPRSLATGNASEAKDLATDCAPNQGLERTWPKRIDVVQKHASAGRSDAAADVAAGLIADVTGLSDCSEPDSAELIVLILQIAGLVSSDPDPESQTLIAQALAAGDAGFVAPIDLSTGGDATSENQCGGVSVPIQPGGGTILVVGFEVDGDPDPFAPFGFQSFRHRYRFETIPAGFEFDVPALAAVELIEAGLGEVDLDDILYARLRNEIVEILGEDVGTRDDAGAEELLACTDIAVALSGWQGWVARALTPATNVLGIDPLFASPAGLGARVSAFSIYAGVVETDSEPVDFELTGGTHGLGGTVVLFDPNVPGGTITSVQVTGPPEWNGGAPWTANSYQPPNIASDKAISWEFIPPITGDYIGATTIGEDELTSPFTINAESTLPPPTITDVEVSASEVSISWTGDELHGSYLVRVDGLPFETEGTVAQTVVGPEVSFVTFSDLSLNEGEEYVAAVFAFSEDIRQMGPLPSQFNMDSQAISFFVPVSIFSAQPIFRGQRNMAPVATPPHRGANSDDR